MTYAPRAVVASAGSAVGRSALELARVTEPHAVVMHTALFPGRSGEDLRNLDACLVNGGVRIRINDLPAAVMNSLGTANDSDS